VLSDNVFTGSLPDSLNELTNLISVDVLCNNFVGTVPDPVGQWDSFRATVKYMNSITLSVGSLQLKSVIVFQVTPMFLHRLSRRTCIDLGA
jgi:hypothetical protein